MSLNFLLKSFSEEDKPKAREKDEISLSGILQRKRLRLGRDKGLIEVTTAFTPYSLAYGFCLREKVAQLVGYHTITRKAPTPKEQLIFDVGKKYHDIIQRYFWKVNMLEGFWRCRDCWYDWWDRSPDKCPQCTKKYNLEYREVPLEDTRYHIRGRADGILYVDYQKAERRDLVDIKSISNKGRQDNPRDPRVFFEDLDELGPIPHHVIQLSTYMMMSGIHNGHLLYVGKNGHQMKSFQIKYNETLLEPYLNDIIIALDWAKELKEEQRVDLPVPCSSKKCECETIIRTYDKST